MTATTEQPTRELAWGEGIDMGAWDAEQREGWG